MKFYLSYVMLLGRKTIIVILLCVCCFLVYKRNYFHALTNSKMMLHILGTNVQDYSEEPNRRDIGVANTIKRNKQSKYITKRMKSPDHMKLDLSTDGMYRKAVSDATSRKDSVSKSTEGKFNISVSRKERYLSPKQLSYIRVSSKEECRNRRLLVYTCGNDLCGGWGDRLKGIVTTFLLALFTNRTFVIDMTKPCEVDNFLEPHKYDWSICKEYARSIRDSHSGSVSKLTMSASKFLTEIETNTSNKHVIRLKSNEYLINKMKVRLQNNSNLHMDGLLHQPHHEIVHRIVHTLFKPNMEFTLDLNKFRADNFEGKHAVCSHIRVGKNPSNPTDSNLPKGGPNQTTVMHFLSRYSHRETYVIYIATDSDRVKQIASSMYTNAVFLNQSIMHIDRPDKKQSAAMKCRGFYTVLFEHYMLTFCDIIVLTRSNFGATAAYSRGISNNLFLFQNSTNSVINITLSDIQTIYKFV